MYVTLRERAMPAIQVAFDKTENIAGMARSHENLRCFYFPQFSNSRTMGAMLKRTRTTHC